MLLPLMLSLAGSALAPATAASARVVSDDPPVKVWLNHDNFQRGDKARVNVRLGDDGYVVVLRADADGRGRVLSDSLVRTCPKTGNDTRPEPLRLEGPGGSCRLQAVLERRGGTLRRLHFITKPRTILSTP